MIMWVFRRLTMRERSNLVGKVDKVQGFMSTGIADGGLTRYFPNILPVTRQVQTSGEVP